MRHYRDGPIPRSFVWDRGDVIGTDPLCTDLSGLTRMRRQSTQSFVWDQEELQHGSIDRPQSFVCIVRVPRFKDKEILPISRVTV